MPDPGVRFFALDDQRFLEAWLAEHPRQGAGGGVGTFAEILEIGGSICRLQHAKKIDGRV